MKQFIVPLLSLLSYTLTAQSRFLEPVFDQVTVTPSIKYGANATVQAVSLLGEAISQPLALDFYEPSGDTAATRPLVLVLPGGVFLAKNQNGLCTGSLRDSAVVEICTRLAKMGYVAAAVDYRLGWNPVSPQQSVRLLSYIQALYRGIQDSRTAIRFFKKTVVEDANTYRVDTTRIVLWGEYTGGQIVLGSAYANALSDWNDPSLIIPPNIPVIIPAYLGNIWGTDYGVLDAGGSALYGLPNGDTLCYANWPGYSSDFQLCVSMAGLIPDLPWVGAGEMPAVLFHAPNDAVIPCVDAILNVQPPINLGIMASAGSCAIAADLDLLGNNQVFVDADINDCLTSNANANNGGLEGFYPFVGLAADKARPWAWTEPCANNPNGPTDGTFARQYLDTVLAYFAPRACAALALCNGQSDPNGLCGTQAKGKVFVDINQNGLMDAGEQPFPNVVLELQPGAYHAVSGPTGKFNFTVSPGDYTLAVPDPPNYYAATDSAISITVPIGADIIQNYGLYPTATVNDLQVSITPLTDPKPGFFNEFFVQWKNTGTTQLSGTVTLTADPYYFILGSMPSANISGNVASWQFDNLQALHGGSAVLHVLLDVDAPLDSLLTSSVLIEATGVTDETPADNIAIAEQVVIGAFDPNDKSVIPEGDVTAEILEANSGWLDYTVRFQNTGTAAASNVYIVDTLSDLLNINSLEVLGSSHPMHWEISGQSTLRCFFDNINLPDSVHNEPASHGFVRYRVKPQLPFSGLLNKTALNFADIYFDFNTPVRTNTAETKFTISSGVRIPYAAVSVRIVPNPAGDFAVLYWPDFGPIEPTTLRVLNAVGEVVFTREIPASGKDTYEKIAVKDWPKGLYFVQIHSKSQVVSGRFVKN